MRVLAAALAACTVAAPASAAESTIYPGVGIGKVKLGMAKAQVVHVLGHEYIVNGRSSNSVELAWNFASWSVTFVGNRAAQVAVSVSSQKTAAGVGPGSSWRKLVRAYPHGVCTGVIERQRARVEYLLPHKGGTQTIYVLPQPAYGFGGISQPGQWRVSEVHVRTPFTRLPEFGPDWPYHCRKDWRTADDPG
jgi:hypothetical protein